MQNQKECGEVQALGCKMVAWEEETTDLENLDPEKYLVVENARVHNLKGVTVVIPRNALTVVTGLSGSGKSSLAFDVIYAEGQRRYLETLSSFARQYLGTLERPDVEYIGGLGPVIAIEQRTTGRNARSTMGTITEIYDFIRLLYARVSTGYSPTTGRALESYSKQQILDVSRKEFIGEKIALLVPQVRGRKGHFGPLFSTLMKRGYIYVRADGEVLEMTKDLRLSRYVAHDIDLLVDRFVLDESTMGRLAKSLDAALNRNEDGVIVARLDGGGERFFSLSRMDGETGFTLPKPETFLFSYNSPRGWCPECCGLGAVERIDRDALIVNPECALLEGAMVDFFEEKRIKVLALNQIRTVAKYYGIDISEPFSQLSDAQQHYLLTGEHAALRPVDSADQKVQSLVSSFSGIYGWIERLYKEDDAWKLPENISGLVGTCECPSCRGARLRSEALCFKVRGKNVHELSQMPLEELAQWLDGLELELEGVKRVVAAEILKEIRMRVGFMVNVGLGYLSLSRSADSLSGGEMQRIRLATQIGTKLVNVVYILDEPSIGLHPRDNDKLIESLRALRDQGNTVIVVEHDEDMMRQANYLVDLGPGAGRHGGKVIAAGTPEEVARSGGFTGKYLRGELSIAIPSHRRSGNGKCLKLIGAKGNNLKNVTVGFPLGQFICVTGVSGSGKSTLINDTLQPILSKKLYRSHQSPLAYEGIEGLEHIDKVVQVDQMPLGRTPRSNPATYTGVFTDIRQLFTQTPEAKMRGYKIGRFSFNVRGGRCEQCKGAGIEVLEMKFLPDVHVQCTQCNGMRYNRETLAVRYKGKDISQVLDMTVNQAVEFFEAVPNVQRKLAMLQAVGVGYVKLGQSSTTLSGGESQRIRLATELARRDSGNTLYILDEPTTGLHFEDIRMLLNVLNALVDRGNTVIVIEHNVDVIKSADYIIDMGPESGAAGGEVVVMGTPEEVAARKRGYTWQYLAKALKKK